jgi:hypothetical protein
MSAVSISPKIPISAENVKIFQYTLIGVLIWFLLTGQLRKYRQATQYEKAGTDVNTSYAIQIRQALNPSGITMMIQFDGTYENDLMMVADQISNLNAVNTAYAELYDENMFERLEKELSSKVFQEWQRRASALPVTQQATTINKRVELAALKDTNVFHASNSSKIAKSVKAGQTIGTKIGTYSIGSTGSRKTYYLVQWTSYFFLISQGFVLAENTEEI